MEDLRQAATVYLPRMAHDFSTITGKLQSTTGSDSAFQRSGEFGPMEVKGSWTALRDLMWSCSDVTSDNVYKLAEGLKSACEAFARQDADAAATMRAEQEAFENGKGAAGQEWSKPYGNDQTAPPVVDPTPPSIGGQ